MATSFPHGDVIPGSSLVISGSSLVIPAKAGIQCFQLPRLRVALAVARGARF